MDSRGRGWGRRGGGRGAPLFLQSVVFFVITLEELQTVLLEAELIINNAPLTYVYANTIETRNMFGTQSFVIWQTIFIFF